MLACRTSVIFGVFLANRDESEASTKFKTCMRGGAGKK